jgi:hypothetical protein
MVTGIEVAGIVLSSFPVAIAGLKFYANGAQSVADLRRYRQVLENFGRDLAIERCIFNNTCSGLLEDAVSDHDLKKLMDEPGGPQCQAQNFRDMLAGRLRGETVSHFMSTVDKLQTAVQKVEHTYRIPPNNEHETVSESKFKGNLKQADTNILADCIPLYLAGWRVDPEQTEGDWPGRIKIASRGADKTDSQSQ